MKTVSRSFDLVGGKAVVVIYGVDEELLDFVFKGVYDEALRLQRIFNLFNLESELSQLNAKRNLSVSSELREVISMAIPYCKLTEGMYDITKGKQIAERKSGKKVSQVGCSYRDISIDGNRISLNHPDVIIDLGSVAKGYMGDRMAAFLKNQGIEDGFIDLRGDLTAFGIHAETIAIQHPRDTEKIILSFQIRNKSVATSGDYSQYYGDYKKSHIIGAKDVISATVIADTLAEADVIATCITVMGSRNLDLFKDKAYLIVDESLNTTESKGFRHETC